MASTTSFLQLHLPHNLKFSPLSSYSSSSSRSLNNNNNNNISSLSSSISTSSLSSPISPISVNSNIFGNNVNPSSSSRGNGGVCFGTSVGYRAAVEVYEDEGEEELIRRFKREVSKAGIIQECRRRRHHENKQEERKRRKREAGLRNRRRKMGPRPYFNSEAEGEVVAKKNDDDSDNWKYSE